jgi:hypothetical protein
MITICADDTAITNDINFKYKYESMTFQRV